MKTGIKFMFCMAAAFAIAVAKTQAAQSERILTFALSGFNQGTNFAGDEVAVPFKVTTKDILQEISIATRTNVLLGKLIIIDSLDNPETPTKIVARTAFTEVDVTTFFEIEPGADVRTTKFANNALKSATFYAIDQFQFTSLNQDPEGIELRLQVFTKETQKAAVKAIGGNKISVISASSASDGNGELSSGNGFIGPVKGSVKIGAPKFVP